MNNQIEGFRLSRSQERLWALELTGAAYLAQCVVVIDGDLNKTALKEAMQQVVHRHEILRTGFHSVPGAKYPVQVVAESAAAVWQEDRPAAGRGDNIERLIRQEKDRFYNFEDPSLLKACLIEQTEHTHILLLTISSLCADSRTFTNLVRELSAAYEARLNGEELKGETVQYVQFAQWQSDLLEEDGALSGSGFWNKQGAFENPRIRLPFQLGSGGNKEYRSDSYSQAAAPEIAAKIDSVARKYSVSSEEFLLACWQTLLFRLTASGKIVIGCEVDGRRYEELKGSFGLFTQSLPISCQFDEADTFNVVLNRVSQARRDASDWQEYFVWPENTGASADPDHFSIGFESIEYIRPLHAGQVSFSILKQTATTERYLLKLKCEKRGEQLQVEFIYDNESFARGAIERLAEQYLQLVESAVERPGARLGDLSLVSPGERSLLLEEWNRTAVEWGSFRPLHEWFEEQVERSPERTAVEDGDARLSYRELNERANRLARRLRQLGVGAEALVGVLMERSWRMVVSLLGVLKAGGAYLPLDVSYPAERLSYIVKDAGVRVVLTQDGLSGSAPEGAEEVVCVDREWSRIEEQSGDNLGIEVEEGNLAYVIYTSGSTGRPKGVMITQRGLRNYLRWSVEAYGVKEGDGSLLHSPVGFDLTVTSLYPPLLVGGRIRVVSEGEGIGGLVSELRKEKDLGLVKLTPAHLEALSQWVPVEEMGGRAKALVIGGEALYGGQLKLWQSYAPGTRLINEYGPTETVVGCCVYEVREGEQLSGAVPIGRPIANTQLYILDSKQQPVGIGESGELYIGGEGLARGYLGRASETAEKFVPNPYSENVGERLYRTGDVARRRWDGEIEYQGREDDQVKLRGYRIELGEIEAVLMGEERVGEVVVALREERGEKRIVAYVTGKRREEGNEEKLVVGELKKYLRERLPGYMRPSEVVLLEAMPLTANGKIDRSALSALAGSRLILEGAYVAPQNEREQAIANLWQEALRLEKVGRADNFFDLGGHSLLMLELNTKLKEMFNTDLALVEMFKYPTVASLAQYLGQIPQSAPNFEQINERAVRQNSARRRQRHRNGLR